MPIRSKDRMAEYFAEFRLPAYALTFNHDLLFLIDRFLVFLRNADG
jgi:hypothetical protein